VTQPSRLALQPQREQDTLPPMRPRCRLPEKRGEAPAGAIVEGRFVLGARPQPGATAGHLSGAQQEGPSGLASITAEVPASPAQVEAETTTSQPNEVHPRRLEPSEDSEAHRPAEEGEAQGPAVATGTAEDLEPRSSAAAGVVTGPGLETAGAPSVPSLRQKVLEVLAGSSTGLRLFEVVRGVLGAPVPTKEPAYHRVQRCLVQLVVSRDVVCQARGAHSLYRLARQGPPHQSLQAWCIERRKALGLSQEGLALAAGVPRSTVGAIETGERLTTVHLPALVEVLGSYDPECPDLSSPESSIPGEPSEGGSADGRRAAVSAEERAPAPEAAEGGGASGGGEPPPQGSELAELRRQVDELAAENERWWRWAHRLPGVPSIPEGEGASWLRGWIERDLQAVLPKLGGR
jgi:transcriptional regulator with XRE-family HTH domain